MVKFKVKSIKGKIDVLCDKLQSFKKDVYKNRN